MKGSHKLKHPILLLNLESSLSLIFIPISNPSANPSGATTMGGFLDSASYDPLSLPTSAKPTSGLLPRDYCCSFPIGLTLYSRPLSRISVVLSPPSSQVILLQYKSDYKTLLSQTLQRPARD